MSRYRVISDHFGFKIQAQDKATEKLRGLTTKLKTVEEILNEYANDAVDLLETDVKELSDLVSSAKELVVRSRRALQNKVTDMEYKDEILAEALRRMVAIPLYHGIAEERLAEMAEYAIDHDQKIVNDGGLAEFIVKDLKDAGPDQIMETIYTKEQIIDKGNELAEDTEINKKEAYDIGHDHYQKLLNKRNSRFQELKDFAANEVVEMEGKSQWLDRYYNLNGGNQ